MSSTANVYESPRAELLADTPVDDPVAFRRQHLRHEAAIAGLGKLNVALSACLLSFSVPEEMLQEAEGLLLFFRIFDLGIRAYGGLLLTLGVLMWARLPVARRWMTVAGAVQLLNLPVGTILGAYTLWLARGEAGTAVLSPRHVAARLATPGIRLPGSFLGWIAALLAPVALLLHLAGILSSLPGGYVPF